MKHLSFQEAMLKVPPEIQTKLLDDMAIYGTCWVKQHEDGTVERVEPETVYKAPLKAQEDSDG